MPLKVYLHPDEACAKLGLVEKPGEGRQARYDRHRRLKSFGLTRYTGPFKGYRYDAAEVDAVAVRLIKPVPKI